MANIGRSRQSQFSRNRRCPTPPVSTVAGDRREIAIRWDTGGSRHRGTAKTDCGLPTAIDFIWSFELPLALIDPGVST